ncbi:hypothetical protein GF407_20240 [candidate division KSB1 bacterium]|nr:hypothetical protein [candidate division KSB1 bacterium]
MKTSILTVCLLCLITAYSHAQLTVKDSDDNLLMTVDTDANVVVGTSQQRGSLSNMGIMGIGRTAWATQQLAIENQIAGISGTREYCRGIAISLNPTQTKYDQNTFDYAKSATSLWLSSQTGSDSPSSLAKLAGIRAYYGGGNQSGGSIDDAIGIELLPATNGASISSMFDILVNDEKMGQSPAPTKHWGIYIEHGGENYFGGPLGIGRDADTGYYMLDVDGAIRCYANVDEYALRCNGDSKTFGDSYIEGMVGIGQDPDATAQVTIQNQVAGEWEGTEYCRGLAIFTKPQADKYSLPIASVSSGLFVSSQLGSDSGFFLTELFGMKAYYGADENSSNYGSVNTVVGLSLRPSQGGSAEIGKMYDIKINNDWMLGNTVTGERWGIYIEHSEDNYFGGSLGLNTHPDPSYMLDVNGDVRCTSLTETSDARLKTGITPLNNALAMVNALNGVSFHWKDPEMGNGDQIGLLAQEVETVVPELVSEDNDGYKSVSYSKMSALFVESIKELQEQIRAQQTEIEDLKHQLNAQ